MDPLHEPILTRMPRHAELQIYCPCEKLTPQGLEAVVALIEGVIHEPISHELRTNVPKPLKKPLAEYVDDCWASPKSTLMLCNDLDSSNHTTIHAALIPRRTADGSRERYGHISVHIRQTAEAAVELANTLSELALETQAHFGRADSPQLWAGAMEFHPIIFPISEKWRMRERLGWLTFLAAPCEARLDSIGQFTEFLEPVNGLGHILRLSPEPFVGNMPEHRARYALVSQALSRNGT